MKAFAFFSLLAILPISLQAQDRLTLQNLLDLKDLTYTQTQGTLLVHYDLLSDNKEYIYQPLKDCKTSQNAADSCILDCRVALYSDRITTEEKLSEPIFEDTSVVAYRYIERFYSRFAANYNRVNETAEWVLDLYQTNNWSSENCDGELVSETRPNSGKTLHYDVSELHFIRLKTEVIGLAEFVEAREQDGFVSLLYEIKEKKIAGQWWGTSILLMPEVHEMMVSFEVKL